MPLTRASGRPILRMDGVRFLMMDGPCELICSISIQALLAFGDKVGMNDAQMIFWAYWDEIERAASDKYDRTSREHYEILGIDENDL
jgi:Protein of unknown function (DUF1488)